MSGHEFKEGDEVQHKTGKIKMIYLGEDEYTGDAICEWTDATGAPQRNTFSHAALKKYQPPEPGVVVV